MFGKQGSSVREGIDVAKLFRVNGGSLRFVVYLSEEGVLAPFFLRIFCQGAYLSTFRK